MSTSAPDDQAAGQDGSGAGPGGVDPQVVLHDLANSTALLPQAMPEGEEPPEGAIALPVIEQDGTQYVPVFTSEEALRAAGADPSTALQLPSRSWQRPGQTRTCGSPSTPPPRRGLPSRPRWSGHCRASCTRRARRRPPPSRARRDRRAPKTPRLASRGERPTQPLTTNGRYWGYDFIETPSLQ
jgi:hypothetical protein